MLDIHVQWLLLLAANFLVLMVILNAILYKPLLQVFRERQDTVKGSLDAAREMDQKKEDGIARMNKELSDARNKAKEIFETMRNDGAAMQKKAFSDSEAEAAEMLRKGREELQREVEKARKSLRADVEKFSDEIVRKLVAA